MQYHSPSCVIPYRRSIARAVNRLIDTFPTYEREVIVMTVGGSKQKTCAKASRLATSVREKACSSCQDPRVSDCGQTSGGARATVLRVATVTYGVKPQKPQNNLLLTKPCVSTCLMHSIAIRKEGSQLLGTFIDPAGYIKVFLRNGLDSV